MTGCCGGADDDKRDCKRCGMKRGLRIIEKGFLVQKLLSG
jgi:hypothetical protein